MPESRQYADHVEEGQTIELHADCRPNPENQCRVCRTVRYPLDQPFADYIYQGAVFRPYLLPNADPPVAIPAFEARPVDDLAPDRFQVLQNYPNPFNPLTTIEFVLPEASIVTLRIVNVLGQEVALLMDHLELDDGHEIVDLDASTLSSGVYFYQLVAEPLSGGKPVSVVKKMMVLK